MKVETEVVRNVFEDSGHYLTVRPWVEVPGVVSLTTDGDKNEEWFGRFNIAMDPEFARQVAKALISCADEVEGRT